MKSKYLDKNFQKDYWEDNKNARTYKHPIVRFFAEQRIDYIKNVIPLKEVKSIFDVGCGDGFATYYLTKEVPKVEGGDISELMLKNNPLGRSSLKIIDAENIDLPASSYDMAIMWEVLHHLDDPAKSVKEMARISRKYVVIFEPNRDNILQFLFGLLNKQERGTLRSSKSYLSSLVNDADLKIISIDYCGKIPPNKTPLWLFNFVKRLPFISNRITGISIAIIAEKVR
jgi:SAM-dependent methyltransferase